MYPTSKQHPEQLPPHQSEIAKQMLSKYLWQHPEGGGKKHKTNNNNKNKRNCVFCLARGQGRDWWANVTGINKNSGLKE